MATCGCPYRRPSGRTGRRSDRRDGAAGAKDELERIITQIRERWPETEILVRGDSGFCRDELMAWCEENRVSYVFGVARNARLVVMIESELELVRERSEQSGRAERLFAMRGWEWANRELGLGLFDRLHQTVMLLDGLLDRPDPDASPFYERALHTRGRLLYWLGLERGGPGRRRPECRGGGRRLLAARR